MKTLDENTSPTIEELENKMKTMELKLQWYEEQFKLTQQRRFGSSSEKTDDNQLALPLFNEAEVSASVLLAEPTLETISYTRKKIGDWSEIQRDRLLSRRDGQREQLKSIFLSSISFRRTSAA